MKTVKSINREFQNVSINRQLIAVVYIKLRQLCPCFVFVWVFFLFDKMLLKRKSVTGDVEFEEKIK